jgi:hypothetical protein
MRYGDVETFARRHHVTTRGAASATSGVFGSTADSAPVAIDSLVSRERVRRGSFAAVFPFGEPSSTRSITGDRAPVTVAAPAST